MALPLAATGAALCTELMVIGRPARELAQRVGAVIVGCAKELFDPYRPELYYMRGPGPKWRMKHGVTARMIPGSTLCRRGLWGRAKEFVAYLGGGQ